MEKIRGFSFFAFLLNRLYAVNFVMIFILENLDKFLKSKFRKILISVRFRNVRLRFRVRTRLRAQLLYYILVTFRI